MHYFVLAVLMACFFQLEAQKTNVNIKWGEIIRTSRNSNIQEIVAYDASSFFVKKVKAGSIMTSFAQNNRLRYSIEKYNRQLKSTGETDLQKLLKGTKEEVEDVFQFQDRLFLLTTRLDRNSKEHQFFLRGLDKNFLSLTSEKIKVYEFEYDWTLGMPSIDFRISRDSTNLMVIYNLPNKRNENDKIGYTIFDENMQKTSQRIHALPVKDRLMEIEDYDVSNNGEVMVLGKEYKGNRREMTTFGKPNYTFRLFYDDLQSEEAELNKIEMTLEDKFITDLKLAFTKKGDIIGAGFYSEEGTKSIKGSYYIKLNKNKTAIEVEEHKAFDIDFIVTEIPERQEKRLRRRSDQGKTVELYEYDLDRLVLRDDGGVVLMAEQYYISTYSRTANFNSDPYSNNRREVVNNYHYNDIIIVNINPDGEIDWASKIPKQQTTSGDNGYYSSYQPAVIKNKIYLFYNDNPKNLFKANSKKDKTHPFVLNRDGVMIMAILNLDGDLKKAKLFRFGESEVYMRPKIALQVSENEIIIYGDKARKMRFGKIVF